MMAKGKKLATILLTGVLLLPAFSTSFVKADTQTKSMDIVFMHDTHSHLNSFETEDNDETVTLGGFARIKTLINEKKEANPDTLVLDAGDFSMGTLIQTIYETEAAELRMLGDIGCEVTTLGNHEFDYRSSGISNMLNAAVSSGDTLPAMVLCNVDWAAMEAEGLTEDQQLIKDAFDNYGVQDYVVLEKGDIKIAVFGVFGEDSLACAPTCVLEFENPVEAAKETVEEIKANEDVDMIVCVSHSGTSEDEKNSEDENMAKEVGDIDLIVSGHTHTRLYEPILHGNTYIVSCGEYGKYLGNLSMTQKDDGRWNMDEYELIPITDEIAQDEATQEKIDGFMGEVDQAYLSKFGYTKDQVLAENDIEFHALQELYTEHVEIPLGNLMADAYRYAVENSDSFDGVPVDLTAVPSGSIRDTYVVGDITVENVFNSFSLGTGPDGVPGYPLISAYFTGKELRTMAEVDASITDYMTSARLFASGLNFTYNPNRIILNKVTDCYVTDADGNRVEIEDDKLYRLVADLYSGQMLSTVTDLSYGLLSIIPKYADGTPIEDLEDVIIMEGDSELKAWDAIARYIDSFEDTDQNGISNVPEYYDELHGRKVVDESTDLISRFKNPNKYAAIIIGAIAVLIFLVVFIIVIVKKCYKKKKSKG